MPMRNSTTFHQPCGQKRAGAGRSATDSVICALLPLAVRPRTDNAENNVEEKAFARNPPRVERDRGFADSPLEGDGFEISVPFTTQGPSCEPGGLRRTWFWSYESPETRGRWSPAHRARTTPSRRGWAPFRVPCRKCRSRRRSRSRG